LTEAKHTIEDVLQYLDAGAPADVLAWFSALRDANSLTTEGRVNPKHTAIALLIKGPEDDSYGPVARLKVNGHVWEIDRRTARSLGLALVAASNWDPAPRFTMCGAPNMGVSGDRSCTGELGHEGQHTWLPENKAPAVPKAREWKFI